MLNSVCLSGNPALLLYRLASYPSNRNTLIPIIIIIIIITIFIIIIIIIILLFSSLFIVLHFFWLFSYSCTLSVTVLTLWVAPPKMFHNWYRIFWSRNQLWNCTHFKHPTDEQLRLLDISSNNNCGRLSAFNCIDNENIVIWFCTYLSEIASH